MKVIIRFVTKTGPFIQIKNVIESSISKNLKTF
jgi:hypothetical protein